MQRMNGRERKDETEGRESTYWKVAHAVAATAVVAGYLGGWATFWKVGGAAAVVGGIICSILEQMEAKPKVRWYKLNVDGSLRRKIQLAGCGGVLWDDSGKWVKGFAQKLDSSLNEDETEREGILRGLKWAKEEEGVRKLKVEADNEGIVDMVKDGTKSKFKDDRILAIRELLHSPDWQTTLTWIPRDANGVAHKLADIGRNLTHFHLDEYVDPPQSCRTALDNDLRLL